MTQESETTKKSELDLDALEDERPIIKLGGASYRVLMPMELTFEEQAKWRKIGRKAVKLTHEMDDIDEDADEEAFSAKAKLMEQQAKELIRSVVDMPDVVREGLSAGQVMAVLNFFMSEAQKRSPNPQLLGISSLETLTSSRPTPSTK